MAKGSAFHSRTKHIGRCYHLIVSLLEDEMLIGENLCNQESSGNVDKAGSYWQTKVMINFRLAFKSSKPKSFVAYIEVRHQIKISLFSVKNKEFLLSNYQCFCLNFTNHFCLKKGNCQWKWINHCLILGPQFHEPLIFSILYIPPRFHL